jgi:Metallo-peptidase family M12B Reprolysin-like
MLRRVAAATALVLAAATVPALGLVGAEASPPAADDTLYRSGGGFNAKDAKVRVTPTKYSAVEVDAAGVARTLRNAPVAGRSEKRQTFRVPTPTGGFERFAVQRTQAMESKLAAAHPEIGTWSGRSLDHPGTTIALDVTPMGFHASVRGANGQGAWLVDPAYNKRGTTTHLSYYAAAVDRNVAQQFVERETRNIGASLARGPVRAKKGAKVVQRVYRLALTTDPSYADYFGTENVLAEKVTLINRVNQIYNDDMAITMRLVNDTDKLNLDTHAKALEPDGPCGAHACFDQVANPNDPPDQAYSQLDFCDIGTLGRNRTVLGQLVGASNYDVGHIGLGVNGGGVAFLGVVGWDYKGSGCTGLPQPQGDFFAIDYVAHELGHQFAGNHSFNGVQFACSGGNREPGTSVEPGSGSSVMAYAGICLQDDLQAHSDPYFSQRTNDEVNAYTDNATLPVTEVQTVSLSGFDTDGEQVTLDFPGAAGPAITLTRGTTYNAAGIEAAIETLTGRNVTVAQWGYDAYGDFVELIAPILPVDDTGFQVIFSGSPDPEVYGGAGDVAALEVDSPSAGVTGFVGETAKGGTAGNGGRTVTTRNHAPKAKAPQNKTIPLQTPFKLTGRGRDSDGDALTFLWEQNDIGGAEGTKLVANKKKNGPLFRVFGTRAMVTARGTLESPSPNENLADGNATRYFPDLAQVLAGNTNAKSGFCPKVAPLPDNLDDYEPVKGKIVDCYSEFLPVKGYRGRPNSTTPSMHFRVTVRDAYPTGGGVDYADVTLKIDPSTGPFLVTSQSKKGTRVRAGSRRLVTWKVNGTSALAKNVRIRLSPDGGETWRTLAVTANDGRASVHIPNLRSSKARIMVEALDNYFYAVNDVPFRIG